MRWVTLALPLVVAGALVACAGDDDAGAPSTRPTLDSAPPGSAAPSTAPRPSTTPASTMVPPPECDEADIFAVVDETIRLARLEPGGEWSTDTEGAAFVERTNPAEEFAARLAFDCSVRAVQRTNAGGERLLVAAWNDLRHAYVIQATDVPATPYEQSVRFQLFVDQPDGEWLEDEFIWAATLSSGESVIVGTHDYSTGVTAKSWLTSVPRFEDLPVTLESERYGIDALVTAGARNVSVAEPAPFGSELGSIQLNTPLSLSVIAVVAPAEALDPTVTWLTGETTYLDTDGVQLRMTTGAPGEYEVAEIGWVCGDHAWRLYTGYGTPQELAAFATWLIGSLDC